MELSEQTINILPDYIANQIAAGEVVQRPESVVKELVENALDSGADSIAVFVRGAGKVLLHVIDNGRGMSRRDLELAPRRHATSKIRTSQDLEKILSFGFRGEALASISAVASLEIRTRRRSDELGWTLRAEPLREVEIEQINCDYGTQVFVRNLFFNVPARKKFLKSDLTEFRYISDTMIRFALSHPDIRFTFYDNDTLIFDVYPEELSKRISNVIGKSVDGALLPINYADELVEINGFIGMPHLAKAASASQYLFMNHRAIQSKNLSYAIFSAFEHLLEKNNKPMFVLNIGIDPTRVDVNVHPQKHEVKFEDDRFIYNALRNSVAATLKEYNLTPEHQLREFDSLSPFIPIRSELGDERMIVNKMTGEIIEAQSKQSLFGSARQFPSGNQTFYGSQSTDRIFRNPDSKPSAFDVIFGDAMPEPVSPQLSVAKRRIEIPDDAEFFSIHNKYILMQTDNGILIIDQHNAHERTIYEKAIKTMNYEFSNSQTLIFPIEVHLSSSQHSTAIEIRNELCSLGYDFELTDNLNATIKSVPIDQNESESASAFTGILDDFRDNSEIRHTNKRERIAASFACKSAIKTGHRLSQVEMRSLAKALMMCNMPYVCPHGRPIILEISLGELDRSFKRTS